MTGAILDGIDKSIHIIARFTGVGPEQLDNIIDAGTTFILIFLRGQDGESGDKRKVSVRRHSECRRSVTRRYIVLFEAYAQLRHDIEELPRRL